MNTRLLIASGAAAVTLIAAPVARADLVFEFSTNGGGPFTELCHVPTAPVGPGSCTAPNGTLGSTNLVLTDATASSLSPGPPNPDLLVTNIGSLANTGETAQTIEFLIGDTGFTNPNPSGLDLISSISGTPGSDPPPPPSSTLSFSSCLDPLDRQNYCAGALAVTTATVQVSFIEGGLPFSESQSVRVISSPVPYSLTQVLTFTLQGFSSVGVRASTDVAAVPEPASIALLGVGLFGMGFLRRRGGKANGIEPDQAG